MKEILKKYNKIIKYLIFGGLTTMISLIIYYGLVFTILNPKNSIELQIANILSWFFSVLFAYTTNRKYVFESSNKKNKEIIKFYLSRIFTLFIDMIFMHIFVTICDFNDKIIKIVVQLIVIILNYVLSKIIVFNKNKLHVL